MLGSFVNYANHFFKKHFGIVNNKRKIYFDDREKSSE